MAAVKENNGFLLSGPLHLPAAHAGLVLFLGLDQFLQQIRIWKCPPRLSLPTLNDVGSLLGPVGCILHSVDDKP